MLVEKQLLVYFLQKPERDISFPIFMRRETEKKKMRMEIRTTNISLNDLLYMYRLNDMLCH